MVLVLLGIHGGNQFYSQQLGFKVCYQGHVSVGHIQERGTSGRVNDSIGKWKTGGRRKEG